MELYRTIRQEACEIQIIERSRFIARAKPVFSREEAEEFLAEIRNEHKDATHNVPAMIIGNSGQIQWASDDGEPQGTSGPPMLQFLASQGLTNLIVVVTRYFGGIKLGTGGLVRAYTSSAKMAIEAAGICSVCEGYRVSAVVDYSHLARIQSAGADEGACFGIEDINYGEKVTIDLIADSENLEKTENMLANITSGTCKIIGTEKTLIKR